MVFCAMTNGYFFSQSFQNILIKVKFCMNQSTTFFCSAIIKL